ncbi:sensor protein VanSB [Spirochaetia bacterium]|nr:sensor protein VanSB [Spirochaetia bacterium]
MPVITKIFAYTMLLLLLMSLAAAGLFAQQLLSFYRSEQRRQMAASYQPMIDAITDGGKSPPEIAEIARAFAEGNQSFKFIIRENGGDILFAAPGPDQSGSSGSGQDWSDPDDAGLEGIRLRIVSLKRSPGSESAYTLTGYSSGGIDFRRFIGRALLALALMIAIAVFGAILFAKKVTKPLEDEIIRERAMEENQRLFFSAASHELKTPIAANRALVEGMLAGIGEYKDHPKVLRECMKTLDSQSRLVSDILEIVKLSDEGPAPIPLDLGDILRPLLDEYRPLAEQRGIEIGAEVPTFAIRTDRNLLYRALSNIIANAVQNTGPGEKILLRAEQKADRSLRLSILNTGANIPEEALPQLFEPFYRLDPARTRNTARSGLGLAIVKKALDRQGIPFALENSPEGVVFWMDLQG